MIMIFLKVEKIQKEVAKAGMSESYYESGPQSISQIVISLSTGLDTLYQHQIEYLDLVV